MSKGRRQRFFEAKTGEDQQKLEKKHGNSIEKPSENWKKPHNSTPGEVIQSNVKMSS